jgi:hypothetical protein
LKFFVLHELTLPVLLLRAALRRRTVILATDAFFPPFNGVLRRIFGRLERTEFVSPLHAELPFLHPAWHHSVPLLANRYEQLEPAIEAYCRFSRIAALPAPYDDAVRHAIVTYVGTQLFTVHAAHELLERRMATRRDIGGMSGTMRTLTATTLGDSEPEHLAAWSFLRAPANVAVTLSVVAVGIGIAFRRISFRRPQPEKPFFALDFIADESDLNLCRELSDTGPVFLIGRKEKPNAGSVGVGLESAILCKASDGRIPWNRVVPVLKALVIDSARLWKACRHLETRLHYRAAVLGAKRIYIDSMFFGFHPRVFWARDVYNPEHILRQHALRAVGGETWSVLHGAPSYTHLYPQFRYIGLNRFYLMTPSLFGETYRERWPKDLTLARSGTFRASRDHYVRRLAHKPPNILVMTSIWTGQEKYLTAIRELSECFPDREIIVQIKPAFRSTEVGLSFEGEIAAMSGNVRLSSESPYDLFMQAKYAISDPSIILLEAIEFGVYGFMFDIPEKHDVAFHRCIDGFSATCGTEFAERIRGIEDGSWPYPIERLSELMRLDGEHFIDTVRRDMGLKPAMQAMPVWHLSDGSMTESNRLVTPQIYENLD